jgi:hypothetical protein
MGFYPIVVGAKNSLSFRNKHRVLHLIKRTLLPHLVAIIGHARNVNRENYCWWD